MNKPFAKIEVKDNNLYRGFTDKILSEIIVLKTYMSHARNVGEWNTLREKAKLSFSENAISAVDGLRKWKLIYDKTTKKRECIGVAF